MIVRAVVTLFSAVINDIIYETLGLPGFCQFSRILSRNVWALWFSEKILSVFL